MKKSLVLSFVVLSLALSFTAYAGTTMTIFSMNLHCGLGDWKGRLDLVINEALDSDADVLGFQEVCFNQDVDMTSYILKGLSEGGYEVTYWKTFNTHRSFIKFHEQLLIITKHKVLGSEAHMLPSMKGFENGYLAINLGNVWAVTTHTHFALPQIRATQFRTLNSIFKNRNTIMFGDMNSNPKDSETGVLKENGWISIFGGPTYPSSNPKSTFDGFWISKSFAQSISGPHFRRLFVNAPVPPSDHLGIELKFQINR